METPLYKKNSLALRWLIYEKKGERFPFWLFIEKEKNKFIFLKAQDKWPGPGKNIFCKYEGEVSSRNLPRKDLVDSCQISFLKREGKRLNLVLARQRRKRCWFIFLKKEYKQKPGQFYHQVFWITQASSIAEKRGVYIPTTAQRNYKILIDKNERYAYRFGNIETERRNLEVGDYALWYDDRILAVAERKTKDNLFHEISSFDVLKIKLEELRKFPHKAVLFESSYSSFVSPKNKFLRPAFVAKILGNLFAQFPDIQFVFFKGRKSANQWLYYYFEHIYQRYVNQEKT